MQDDIIIPERFKMIDYKDVIRHSLEKEAEKVEALHAQRARTQDAINDIGRKLFRPIGEQVTVVNRDALGKKRHANGYIAKYWFKPDLSCLEITLRGKDGRDLLCYVDSSFMTNDGEEITREELAKRLRL